MRSVVLRSLVVIAAGAVVLAGVLFVASTIDTRPPEVIDIAITQPAADDPDLALITTSVEVQFSEPVAVDAAVQALSFDPSVDGGVSWSGSTLIFTPTDPLELDARYEVRIRPGVPDLAGNEMTEEPDPFTFRTAGRPEVVQTVPAHGAADVGVDETIALTFSRLMDTASVEAELRLRPAFGHELRWSGELLEIVPTSPLRAGQEYEVLVHAGATDVSGTPLAEDVTLQFRTATASLTTALVMPADGVDGVAPETPIAVVFDRPIDPESFDAELLTIEPAVAGTLELVAHPDDPADEDEEARVLRFTPSGPLPHNTTFEVELATGLAGRSGGSMAQPLSWSFTTGAPVATISNQVTFLSDRSGVPNVWAMNPDGTAKRQLSAELTAVLDYAVAPDGSSLVVGDGRRLVYLRADGGNRRVLTDDGRWEFDAAYAPDSTRIAFARADAASGEGRGLWEWEIGGRDPEPIVIPAELGDDPDPTDSAGATLASLRAPRYAPDGQALAFVDVVGWIGMLELPGERLTRAPFDAAGPPAWLPDSSAILVNGRRAEGTVPVTTFAAPVGPLVADEGDGLYRLGRSGTSMTRPSFASADAQLLAIGNDGRVAYREAAGTLRVAEAASAEGGEPVDVDGQVRAAAFAPSEPELVVAVARSDGAPELELVDLSSGVVTELGARGERPRWSP